MNDKIGIRKNTKGKRNLLKIVRNQIIIRARTLIKVKRNRRKKNERTIMNDILRCSEMLKDT